MSLITGLKRMMFEMALTNRFDRKSVAHFCEHDGIHIRFTRARSVWHAVAPLTIRPWWILLEPTKFNKIYNNSNTHNKNKIETTEVIDNA